jgi:hypothetical protein
MGIKSSNDRIRQHAGNEPSANSQIEVFVLYTGVQTTLAALRLACRLADGMNARIQAIHPQVVPYSLPIDEPTVAQSLLARRFKAIVQLAEVEMSIRVYRCRSAREALSSILPARSLVFIGVEKRWWPTRIICSENGCALKGGGAYSSIVIHA